MADTTKNEGGSISAEHPKQDSAPPTKSRRDRKRKQSKFEKQLSGEVEVDPAKLEKLKRKREMRKNRDKTRKPKKEDDRADKTDPEDDCGESHRSSEHEVAESKRQKVDDKATSVYNQERKGKKSKEVAMVPPSSGASSTTTTEPRTSTGPRPTISVAIAGSIMDNVQTPELKTYVAGAIARTLAVFQVDEVVVYDDGLGRKSLSLGDNVGEGSSQGLSAVADEDHDGASARRGSDGASRTDPNTFLARILQYVETPQYLRKRLFPVHRDLRFAGLLNPLDAPHHMRRDEWREYREGVVMDEGKKEEGGAPEKGSMVNVGLMKYAQIDRRLQKGVRVTVRMDPNSKNSRKGPRGVAVSPSEPKEKMGWYWGYSTRLASSIGKIFSESPFPGGYDLTLGTSERGNVTVDDEDFGLPKNFRHLLVVFGGVAGIEECVDADESLTLGADRAKELFDMWVNTCPEQGSRTIRTEEAIMISLAALRPFVRRATA